MSTETNVDAQTRSDIENLIYQHAWLLDHHESARLADLYVENGRLVGIGMNHVGREAIATYGSKRAQMSDRIARHACSNLRLQSVGPNRVEGKLMITLFRHDGPGGLPNPNALADAHDTYVKGADGTWRFEERRLELVFESEAHKQGSAKK